MAASSSCRRSRRPRGACRMASRRCSPARRRRGWRGCRAAGRPPSSHSGRPRRAGRPAAARRWMPLPGRRVHCGRTARVATGRTGAVDRGTGTRLVAQLTAATRQIAHCVTVSRLVVAHLTIVTGQIARWETVARPAAQLTIIA